MLYFQSYYTARSHIPFWFLNIAFSVMYTDVVEAILLSFIRYSPLLLKFSRLLPGWVKGKDKSEINLIDKYFWARKHLCLVMFLLNFTVAHFLNLKYFILTFYLCFLVISVQNIISFTHSFKSV